MYYFMFRMETLVITWQLLSQIFTTFVTKINR